jgi:hypothetical protein
MELKKTGPLLPLEWAPPPQPLIANIGKPLYATQREEKTRKGEEEPAIIAMLADVGV